MSKLYSCIFYKDTIFHYHGDNVNNNDDDYEDFFQNRLKRQYNYGYSIYDIHYDYNGFIINHLADNPLKDQIFDFIKNNDFDSFKTISMNINPFMKNEKNESILEHILEKGLEDYLKIFIENRLNINLFDENTLPVITNMVIKNNLEGVKLILKYGGNINKTCFERKTPLYYAVLNNNYNIVSFLVNNGALVNKKALNDKTPQVIALEKNDLELIKLLINNEYNRETVFKKCCEYGFIDALQTLLENVEYDNDILISSADICILFNHLECLKLLFKYIKNVNDCITYRNDFFITGKIKCNRTLLHTACEVNNKNFLIFLLENNCDINFKNDKGESILEYAVKLNKSNHIKILQEKGFL